MIKNQMTSEPTIRLKFWGTRGSIPCPGPDTVRYGGNTTCFEITCGERRIISRCWYWNKTFRKKNHA